MVLRDSMYRAVSRQALANERVRAKNVEASPETVG